VDFNGSSGKQIRVTRYELEAAQNYFSSISTDSKLYDNWMTEVFINDYNSADSVGALTGTQEGLQTWESTLTDFQKSKASNQFPDLNNFYTANINWFKAEIKSSKAHIDLYQGQTTRYSSIAEENRNILLNKAKP
jgi:hypothetical protein